MSDIALFEPNQRGRRAFDVFLAAKARQLDAADLELAQRMGKAFFSLFRCTARHEVAGVWLEDLLAGNRRLADDEALVLLARVGRARPDLVLSIISALEEIDSTRAVSAALGLKRFISKGGERRRPMKRKL
jgi:hypothetical protein